MKTRILLFIALCMGLAGTACAASLMQPDGIPDRFIGASNAPSTLIVYSSPTCPPCIRFEEQVLPLIKSRYVDSGRLRVSVRPTMNNAVDGAILLIADAGGLMRRDATLARFREKRSEIMAAKDREKLLREVAAQSGVDRAAYDRAMKNSDHQRALQRLTDQAYNDFDIKGTPSFFLDGVKIKYDGTINSFARVLDQAPRR
ncbi:thioredoxin domain-containing protein [Acidovorax sp. CCYZU-2555]|uniref:thioredoxin domain-containing protein n=1 Tax=Acidovorax sp. CCYZU-2555 TaxID=2835042 RepID=UPI001BCB96E4|nr:thioredoxin domain-containing protein [Acidovorax sp. CCYZU-2555]MBS7778320.1 thioredoxin domain-containing protein [Acidovorax sp. CCYZU-2555]